MKRIGSAISIIALIANSTWADLRVVADTGETMAITPYIADIKLPNQADITAAVNQESESSNQYKVTTDAKSISYPAESDLTEGSVDKTRIKNKHFATLPMFVIGNDAYSVKWAKQNAAYLKRIHAFGIITNVENQDATAAVESATGLTLTPMNLTGLGDLIGTSHYPLLIDKGWIVQ